MNTITSDGSLVISQTNHYASSGIVRWNSSYSRFEVDQGSLTIPMTGSTHITLSTAHMTVLRWAEQKMMEEQKREQLIKKYPMVGDLQSKLDMMISLVKDYEEEKVN